MVVAPTGAGATQPGPVHKVTICHRTNSVTNPYVMPTVDFSAANGTIQGGPDHTGHAGPVFDFDALDAPGFETTYPKPRSGDQWGDIIPPVPFGEGQLTTGMNWTEEGQAVLAAGCQAPTAPPESPVVIVEKTVPDVTVEDEFRFRVNGGTDTIIEDEDSEEFSVAAGQVTIAEDLTSPGGYLLQSVACSVQSSTRDESVPVTPVDGAVSFDISAGEIITCEFTNVPTPGYSVTIAKTNNADGDDEYTDSERTSPDADVPFKLVITNTGTGDLEIESLTDTWPGRTDGPLDLLAEGVLDCGGGVGLTEGDELAAGAQLTCFFTVAGYAPEAGRSLTNTVTLGTDEAADVSDTSVVTTQDDAPTYGVTIVKTNNADGLGDYSDSEQTTPSAAVPFKLVITNTGTGALEMESLEDTWPGQVGGALDLLTVDALDCGEQDLSPGDVLAAGATLTCTFTVNGYAPPAGGSLTNTVTLGTNNADDVSDTSVVTTPQDQIPPLSPTYAIDIEKLNDANGVGGFSDVETADDEGDDVEFQVTIRNTGTGSVIVQSLTDTFDGETINVFDTRYDLRCPGLSNALSPGSVLAAGSTTVCTFEVPNYAPAAGDGLVNRVTIVTDQVSDSDTSTVRTQEIDVLPETPVERPPVTPVTPGEPPVVTPPVDTPPQAQPNQVLPNRESVAVKGDVVTRQLPRTGSDTSGLAAVGAGLLAIGAAMVLSSRLRFRRFD